MKAIRIQIDMLYQVEDDEIATKVYEGDVQFFESIKHSFHGWKDDKEDPRMPAKFDLRHQIGPVISDSDDQSEAKP